MEPSMQSSLLPLTSKTLSSRPEGIDLARTSAHKSQGEQKSVDQNLVSQ